MNKTAFFTIDVETFFDTSCIRACNAPYREECDGKDGFSLFLALLEKYNIHATLFLTKTSIDKWSDEIERAKNNGHELAVHALVHESPVGYTDEKFVSDVCEMRDIIKSRFGVNPVGYRAPCFGLNDRLLKKLKELGFLYDSSALNYKKAIGAGNVDLSGFKSLNDIVYENGDFYEFKPQTARTFFGNIPVCGGGYTRLLPWNVIKPALRRTIDNSDGYLFYVHPFEMSAQKFPKYKDLKLTQKMFIDCGRKKYINRVEKIIGLLKENGYEFLSVAEYIDKYTGV